MYFIERISCYDVAMYVSMINYHISMELSNLTYVALDLENKYGGRL